jgi:hypothetical protein
MELSKATLQEISGDNPPRDLGTPIKVQFNPTTLRLQLTNQAEGGKSRGKQTRQFLGNSSTSLTLDLVFDTADEGDTETPQSVRKKTALVEKFVVPKKEGSKKQAPPKIRFSWGKLVIEGVVESVNIDFDHFAPDGTPLRAKVGLAIKEQDGRYMYMPRESGANNPTNAPAPGQNSSGTPGSSGSGNTQSALALAGESAADFAARVGVDPGAWRGLAAGLNSTLSIEAGIEIGFDANISLGAGMGATLGVQGGASLSLDASLGLAPGVTAVSGVGTGADLAAGFKLSAAGGVGPALESAKMAKYNAAARSSEESFGESASKTAATASSAASSSTHALKIDQASGRAQPGLPEQDRAPLSRTGLPTPGRKASSALRPVTADVRATSFGFGVPLRPSLGGAAETRTKGVMGAGTLGDGSAGADPPTTYDPSTPRWIALPANSKKNSGSRMDKRVKRCGCAGRCAHESR